MEPVTRRATARAPHFNDGIKVGGRPFRRRFRASWGAIRAIDVGDRFASIVTSGGRSKRIDLQDLENAGAVRSALIGARERLAAGSQLER